MKLVLLPVRQLFSVNDEMTMTCEAIPENQCGGTWGTCDETPPKNIAKIRHEQTIYGLIIYFNGHFACLTLRKGIYPFHICYT